MKLILNYFKREIKVVKIVFHHCDVVTKSCPTLVIPWMIACQDLLSMLGLKLVL